jgi:hypothetical protein
MMEIRYTYVHTYTHGLWIPNSHFLSMVHYVCLRIVCSLCIRRHLKVELTCPICRKVIL